MKGAAMEVVTGADPALVGALKELHDRAVPPRLRYAEPRKYFREALSDPGHINILARDADGLLVGYILGIPQSRVFQELQQWDPEMVDDPDRLYLDTILVLPDRRGQHLGYHLVREACREAERRGYFKLSMHARTTIGWSGYLQRIFAEVKFQRRIENWFGFGEPFDYLEARTTLKPLKKQVK